MMKKVVLVAALSLCATFGFVRNSSGGAAPISPAEVLQSRPQPRPTPEPRPRPEPQPKPPSPAPIDTGDPPPPQL
jgi:hypothetical protein